MNSKENKHYDTIVVGAGAAGLFFAATTETQKGLIIEKSSSPGKKLLITGGGQCNITHAGDIKEFMTHYGDHGKKIRTPLYKLSNEKTETLFNEMGLETFQRPDGKIFPKSLKAKEVLDTLVKAGKNNNFSIETKTSLQNIIVKDNGFIINNKYNCENLVIATGGCSIPESGSDGKVFSVIEEIGVKTVDRKPAIVPIYVQKYPFTEISGTSFENIDMKLFSKKTEGESLKAQVSGDLLITHNSFSGPGIFGLSRWAQTGMTLQIDFCPKLTKPISGNGISKNIENYISEVSGLSKGFIHIVLKELNIDSSAKTSTLPGKDLKRIKKYLKEARFSISGTGGYDVAMVTAGGVALSEVSMKTMEHKSIPNLYFIGETLDVDGDTGGYNLQFAFSSAYTCGQGIMKKSKEK